jgi:hypothetical protein
MIVVFVIIIVVVVVVVGARTGDDVRTGANGEPG